MKITKASLCENSSMINSYVIEVEINPNYLLPLIISLAPISRLNFVTRML